MSDAHPKIFTDLPDEIRDLRDAAAIVIPVPYDLTSSWLRGSAAGPEAILEASQYVEVWDIETASEPWRSGIVWGDPVRFDGPPDELALRVDEIVVTAFGHKQLPIVVGGEHSVTLGAARAAANVYPEVTILQIDAHADTRQTYRGTAYGHASVMARIREHSPIVQVGIRSVDTEEVPDLDLDRVFWAKDIVADRDQAWIDAVVDRLSNEVYVTIDMDGFDPSLVPATGTPEPGGLGWYEVNDLLARVAASRRVVGFDVVELLPGHPPSAFLAAKLIYRFLAEIQAADRARESGERPGPIE